MEIESAVLRAFTAAICAGWPIVECYRAGVGAWQAFHPEHSPQHAAKQAVAIILAARAGRLGVAYADPGDPGLSAVAGRAAL